MTDTWVKKIYQKAAIFFIKSVIFFDTIEGYKLI